MLTDKNSVDFRFFGSTAWQDYMKKSLKSKFQCEEVEYIDNKYLPKKCAKEFDEAKVNNVVIFNQNLYATGWKEYITETRKEKILLKDVIAQNSEFIPVVDASKTDQDVVVVPEQNNVIKGDIQDLEQDKTVLRNDKVINLPDNNQSTYLFKSYRPLNSNTKLTYANVISSQGNSFNPNYFPPSLISNDYSLDFKTNYALPPVDFRFTPLNEFKSLEFKTGKFNDVTGGTRSPSTGIDFNPEFQLHQGLNNKSGIIDFNQFNNGLPDHSLHSDFKFEDFKIHNESPLIKTKGVYDLTSQGFNTTKPWSPQKKFGQWSLNDYSVKSKTGQSNLENEEKITLNGQEEIKSENLIPASSDTEEDKPHEEPNCEEELNKALASLLEDDKKNIIGLQYELTVLKVASAVVGNKNITLEGLIRSKSKSIQEADQTKILERMGEVYKKHGLPEDQQKIYEHLKTKSSSANYYAGDKRFFNDESSAFMMAYQHLYPDTGIKETDISVLWFMNKVSQKAKSQWKNFSAGHNLTNLSTRVAYYTGGINPQTALSKEKIDEMVKSQSGKLNKELLALIEEFKNSNKACYDKFFAEGADDCNIGVVEENLSKLLAVNSKIESTDLISLDNYLKGGLDKTRFRLSRYVAESAK